jgi:hypothetical protein
MAARISTMSDSSLPPSLPLRSEFPRKLLLLFLLSLDTAIGIFFLFRQRPEIPVLVRHLFADLTIGVVAGFAARFLFRRRGWFVRFIAATAALIIGLLVLGVLTEWRTGFGPVIFWRTTIDWSGMAQIALGLISIFLAMQAWSRPARSSSTAVISTAPVSLAPVQPALQTSARPNRRRKKSAPGASGSNDVMTKSVPARTDLRTKPVITRKRIGKADSKPAPGNFRIRPQVRLSKVEKHLCPYCLEPVVRKDPRGIVECEICHTLHHGDCWAIAGSCQVPHYTA